MFKGFILQETVDINGLMHLLHNIKDLIVPEERTKFKKYAQEILANPKGNYRMVKYAKVAHGYGRVYADGALSMQGFSKGIRKHLAANLYHDIDIVNCHPVLLAQICEKHGWEAPHLNHYISNREAVLKTIIGKTRDESKTMFLMIMYGADIHNNATNGFKEEMGRIAHLVDREYPHIPGNHPFSRMSLLLQDIEHHLMMKIATFFESNGYQIGVYVFDGLMVYRKNDTDITPLLRKCEESLNIKLVEKC